MIESHTVSKVDYLAKKKATSKAEEEKKKGRRKKSKDKNGRGIPGLILIPRKSELPRYAQSITAHSFSSNSKNTPYCLLAFF